MGLRGIFVDIETTGLDPLRHRALEVAIKVIDLSDGNVLGSYSSILKQPVEVWERSDPLSLSVNGFKWEDLADGREEAQVTNEIIQLLRSLETVRGKSFFIAQNPTFDRAFFAQLIPVYRQEQLQWPYHWLDFASMYWALRVHQLRSTGRMGVGEELSLSKDIIAKENGLLPEPQPHRAMNGVDHLIHCYSRVVGWLGQPLVDRR